MDTTYGKLGHRARQEFKLTVIPGNSQEVAQQKVVDVSVIIVSFNTRKLTLRCINSIYENTRGITFEVIIIDNKSRDGSAAAIREKFPRAKVISSEINGGFGYGNNRGFEICEGRHVLVLNPDTEVHSNTISKCMEYMDANQRVGVLGCRVVYSDGQQQSTIFRFLRLRHLFASCFFRNQFLRNTTLFGDIRYSSLSRDKIQNVEVVAGCFMFVRCSVLEEVGGFDEIFFMYSEEAEWCHRIRKAGWLIQYFPAAEIMHHGAASTGESEWKSVEIAKGQILFMRLTRGFVTAYIANAIMLTRDLLRLFYYRMHRVFRDRAIAPSSFPGIDRLKFHFKVLRKLPGEGKN